MVIPNYESPPPIVTEVPELEPAPKPQAPAVERPQAPQPEQLADADRLPPPPLYQCNTWDNQKYLSEDADPKPRCVQLQTTGLAGDPNRARSEENTSELRSLMRSTYAVYSLKNKTQNIT